MSELTGCEHCGDETCRTLYPAGERWLCERCKDKDIRVKCIEGIISHIETFGKNDRIGKEIINDYKREREFLATN